jgi:hypothetical protein
MLKPEVQEKRKQRTGCSSRISQQELFEVFVKATTNRASLIYDMQVTVSKNHQNEAAELQKYAL